MECLSGTYVRLRSRLKGTYLHADKNGVSVSLSPDRGCLNTAWRVQAVHLRHLRRDYISLQGAANGRYLTALPDAQHGRGHFLLQNIFYGERENVDALWMPLAVWEAAGSEFRLRHCRYSALHLGVTVQTPHDLSTRWIIEILPWRLQPPLLPNPVPPFGLASTRTIVYARADDGGITPLTSWGRMQFKGLSVLKLRTQLACQLGEENPSNITLCTWTGYDSAWIPLVVDLPSNNEITVILVLNTKSPVALALRHPDVDAE